MLTPLPPLPIFSLNKIFNYNHFFKIFYNKIIIKIIKLLLIIKIIIIIIEEGQNVGIITYCWNLL